MKKLAAIFLFSLLFLATASVTFAKEPNSPFRVTKEERQETVQEKVATLQASVVARRRQNISKFLRTMVARLKATVVRLELLISRIEKRLDKIASENPEKDLTAIKTQVESAKTLLKETTDKISELETTGDTLVESDTPKVVFEQVRKKLGEIKKDLTQVHRILVHVIGDIKGLRVGEDKNENK